jgi:hypothetical protein
MISRSGKPGLIRGHAGLYAENELGIYFKFTELQNMPGNGDIVTYSHDHSPALPPDLRIRRMSCRVIARSTALHMSYTVNSAI